MSDGMGERVETMPASRGGRPPLDRENGATAQRAPGIFLAPQDMAQLNEVTAAIATFNGCSPAEARRYILRTGIRAVAAQLAAAANLADESREVRARMASERL